LWPLVFGMLVIVPPQIYIERLHRGTFQGSYLEFYTSVFELVPYPAGSLSWHHLWFVAYLFVFCMVALPLFAWLRTQRGQALLGRAEAVLARGWGLWLLFLPLGLGRILLRHFPATLALVNDPNTLVYYGQLFLAGYLLGHSPRLWELLAVRRRVSLALTVSVFALMTLTSELPFPFEHLGLCLVHAAHRPGLRAGPHHRAQALAGASPGAGLPLLHLPPDGHPPGGRRPAGPVAWPLAALRPGVHALLPPHLGTL
jgi:hypothetical protein